MSLTHKECTDILWNKHSDMAFYCFKKDIDNIHNQLPLLTMDGTSVRLISNPFPRLENGLEEWITPNKFQYFKKLKEWKYWVAGHGELTIYEEDEIP